MKYTLAFFLLLSCIAQNHYADAFIVNLVSGAVSTLQGHVNNTVNTVSGHINNINTAVNIANLGGQFLWDNALKPSLDTFTNS